jgi:hypothetical protein
MAVPVFSFRVACTVYTSLELARESPSLSHINCCPIGPIPPRVALSGINGILNFAPPRIARCLPEALPAANSTNSVPLLWTFKRVSVRHHHFIAPSFLPPQPVLFPLLYVLFSFSSVLFGKQIFSRYLYYQLQCNSPNPLSSPSLPF